MRRRLHLDPVVQLLIWIAVVAAMVAIFAVMLIRPAPAAVCQEKPDWGKGDRSSDGRWRWRNVDGRKCWYRAPTVLPATDLVWSYTEQEFNSDIDRVLERKIYNPEPD